MLAKAKAKIAGLKNKTRSKKAIYVTDIFPDIATLNIGDHIFDEKKMEAEFYFNAVQNDKVIPLLKKVFQEKYGITRIHGMPKVPSDPVEKKLLIDILVAYFHKQRELIIQKRMDNFDSVVLRESINHLQKIKILIEHFDDSLDTFPYDQFQAYLDNKDFINAQENIEESLRHLSSIKDEDKRIRNLLRQFAKVYMKRKTDSSFVISDPGLISYVNFPDELAATYKNKVTPPILPDVMEVVEAEGKHVDNLHKTAESAREAEKFANLQIAEVNSLLEKANADKSAALGQKLIVDAELKSAKAEVQRAKDAAAAAQTEAERKTAVAMEEAAVQLERDLKFQADIANATVADAKAAAAAAEARAADAEARAAAAEAARQQPELTPTQPALRYANPENLNSNIDSLPGESGYGPRGPLTNPEDQITQPALRYTNPENLNANIDSLPGDSGYGPRGSQTNAPQISDDSQGLRNLFHELQSIFQTDWNKIKDANIPIFKSAKTIVDGLDNETYKNSSELKDLYASGDAPHIEEISDALYKIPIGTAGQNYQQGYPPNSPTRKNVLNPLEKIINEWLARPSNPVGRTLNQEGGKLIKYCKQIANEEVCSTPFTLIEEFETASNLDVKRSANEQYMFESFLEAVLEEHFSSDAMKEFYFEAHEVIGRKSHTIANLCFRLLEVCDAIKKSKLDIDVVRLSSSELNGDFDDFEQDLRNANYDFFSVASKEIHESIHITFSKHHIYFYKHTNSFVNTYTINDSMKITEEYYDFNEDLYYVNDSVVYFFFILSNYFYMKNTMPESPIGKLLDKYSRTLKRKKNIKSKSIKKLLEERWESTK